MCAFIQTASVRLGCTFFYLLPLFFLDISTSRIFPPLFALEGVLVALLEMTKE
jgi:hypothetical protein